MQQSCMCEHSCLQQATQRPLYISQMCAELLSYIRSQHVDFQSPSHPVYIPGLLQRSLLTKFQACQQRIPHLEFGLPTRAGSQGQDYSTKTPSIRTFAAIRNTSPASRQYHNGKQLGPVVVTESRHARGDHFWIGWCPHLSSKHVLCLETAYSVGSVSKISGLQGCT